MSRFDRDQLATAAHPMDSEWISECAAFWRKSLLLFAGALVLLVAGFAIMLAQVPRGAEAVEVSTDEIVNGSLPEADQRLLAEFRTLQKMEAAQIQTARATGEAQ